MWGFLQLGRATLARETANSLVQRSTLASRRRWFGWSAAAMAPVRDPNTLSNYDAWRTRHTAENLKIEFEKKRLAGSVVLELESQADEASKEIILDASYLD